MSTQGESTRTIEQCRADLVLLRDQVRELFIGQDEFIDGVLTGLAAGGHVLVEGPPGLGKTLLGRIIAALLEADFRRIQFTSDLMPADVTGTFIVLELHGQRRFEFQEGPLFANVVLADEITRATPKTQAALLEGMQEHAVTIANKTYELPDPFFVIATQSPLYTEGTFPLPETLLDRFLLKLRVEPPVDARLDAILARAAVDMNSIRPVLSGDSLAEIVEAIANVPVPDDVRRYAVKLVSATHPRHAAATEMVKRFVSHGASPRGGEALLAAAKVRAVLSGRDAPQKDDIRQSVTAALAHRLPLNLEALAENATGEVIVQEILQRVS